MNEFLQDLVHWIDQLSPLVIYLVVFALSFIENLLPPVPGDLVIVFAGYLVGLDRLSFAPSVITAGAGGLLGFMVMFAFGRRLGNAVISPDQLVWIPKKRIARALDGVAKYGALIVAANRFLPGLRSVISLAAGMSSMRLGPTVLASAASAMVWCWLMVLVGKHLGENWAYVSVLLRRYSLVFLGLVVVFLAVQGVRYVRHRRFDEADGN